MQDAEHRSDLDNVTRFRWRNVTRPSAGELDRFDISKGVPPCCGAASQKGFSEWDAAIPVCPRIRKILTLKKYDVAQTLALELMLQLALYTPTNSVTFARCNGLDRTVMSRSKSISPEPIQCESCACVLIERVYLDEKGNTAIDVDGCSEKILLDVENDEQFVNCPECGHRQTIRLRLPV